MSEAPTEETVANPIDPLVAEARAAIGCWMSGTWRNPYAATQFHRLLEEFIKRDSAAPDLLEALKRIERQLTGYAEFSPADELHRVAVAAIDKAEGRKRPERGYLGSTPWGEIDDSP